MSDKLNTVRSDITEQDALEAAVTLASYTAANGYPGIRVQMQAYDARGNPTGIWQVKVGVTDSQDAFADLPVQLDS